MENSVFYPRLCGGTFFTLLTRAMKRGQRSHSFGSDRAQITMPQCLSALISVMDPENMPAPSSTFDSNVSAYKKCDLSANTYLPFDNDIKISAFDAAVASDYQKTLQKMAEFTDTFIEDGSMSEWLIRAVIELIQKDLSIGKDEVFYVTPDGNPTSKANIAALSVILLPAFLLGVWHYIVVYRKDNSIGAETYRRWHSFGAKGSRPEFNSTIGKNEELTITVLRHADVDGTQNKTYQVSSAPTAGLTMNYSTYLQKLEDDYGSIKNLLYETPHPLRSFYVCNDIIRREVVLDGDNQSRTRLDRVSNIDIEKLEAFSNFNIIVGTGGIGKSMTMHHLLLDAIDRFEATRRLPVFISLRDYPSADMDITDFIYEQLCKRLPGYPHDEYIRAIGSGSMILLLDGLDEINLGIRGSFEAKLEQFTSAYRQNLFIVSSRPYSKFIHLTHYNLLYIQPFTKDQALEMVSKLDYDEAIKAKFARELDESLFNVHKDFAENPLLLTIMLMTYETFAEVPSKIHEFYRLAYETMAQKHDASKVGQVKRVLRSKLTSDRLKTYLAEFFAISYTEGVRQITRDQAEIYLNMVKEHIAEPGEENLRITDFMDDIVNSLCLMYPVDDKYRFNHRSFQEYFTALFMSKQMDDQLWQIGQFFEEPSDPDFDLRHDKTFLMLYDMIPEKVERFILRRYLEELFAKTDAEHGYWSYLDEIYDRIEMESGNVSTWTCNEPRSFTYDFICNQYGIKEYEDDIDDAPYDEDFMTSRFVFGCNENGRRGLIDIGRPYSSDDTEQELEGWCLSVYPLQVCKYPKIHNELFALMNDSRFPFKREYLAMRRLLEDMRQRQDKPRNTLRSLFSK